MPSDIPALMDCILRIAEPLGGSAMNLRVSARALEVDIFVPRDANPAPLEKAFASWRPVLTLRRLDNAVEISDPGAVIEEARKFFNEERYWEVHEVLEALWKKESGKTKSLLQGLILVAAALVHHQKNQNVVMPKLLQQALERLPNQRAVFQGIDIERLRGEIRRTIESGEPNFSPW